jgi:hypothetical protein
MCQAWFGLRAWVWAVLESAHSGLLILEPDVTCNVMYNTTSLEYIYIYIPPKSWRMVSVILIRRDLILCDTIPVTA